jgi:DNA helicase IV
VWVETPESLYLRLTGKEFTPQILEETRTNSLSEIGVILPSEVSETDRLYVCQDQIWIEILEKLENLDIKFAAVCIDEGQDFWGPLYQVLDEQTMDEGTFAIFADEHQTTRTRATFRPYELERPGFHEVHLRANLRNSPAIAKEINREFSPLVEYQVNGLLQSGAPPTTYLWASNPQLWQQLESVYAEIKKTLSTDVVLLLDSECSTTTRNMLARTAEIFSWKVYTVDEFKGLECDIVIAVNSKRDGITNAIEALWKQRYVAYSRTRGFLYILQESTDDAQLNAKYRPKKKKSSPRNES